MIARLNGTIVHAEGNTLIVDVGGVGYEVAVPVAALAEVGSVGSPVTVFTHTYVREDELSLYGFVHYEDLKAFEILIGVSGVGPKVAMAVLSSMDAATLAHAVTTGDTRTLVKTPGLGLKTAQRLVLELRDKMGSLLSSPAGVRAGGSRAATQPAEQFKADIVDALVGLGYSRKDAERAAERVIGESDQQLTSAAALREALNVLTGNRP